DLREEPRRLDGALSFHNGGHKRDRLHVSVSRFYAGDWGGHPIARGARGRDLARYRHHLARNWRGKYVITAVIALYFNVFVLIAQLFEKVPALHALAPKGSEPPFVVTEIIVMVIFIALGIAAVKGFREPTAVVREQSARAA